MPRPSPLAAPRRGLFAAPRSGLLASTAVVLALAGLCTLTPPAAPPARAQTAATASFTGGEFEPLVEAVRTLWTRIGEQRRVPGACAIPGNRVRLAVVFPIDDNTFDAALQENLRPHLEGRLNQQQGAFVQTEGAAATDIDLRVEARGARESGAYYLTLRAAKRDGSCPVVTERVRLPDSMVGEQILPPEQFFTEVASEVLARETGPTRVFVTPPKVGDGTADPGRWAEVRDLIDRGLNAANRAAGGTREIAVVQVDLRTPEERATVARDAWVADVTLQPRPQSLGVAVSFARVAGSPAANTRLLAPVVREGVIDPRALPAVAPENLPRMAVQTSAGPVDAPELTLDPQPRSFRGNVTRESPVRTYAFKVTQPSVIEVDLPVNQLRGDPDYRIINDRTDLVQPDTPRRVGSPRPNVSRYILDPGLYALQVGARDDAEFVLRIRSSAGALAPEPNGTVIRTVGDWTVGERVRQDGARVCFARTVSNNHSPSDWRAVLPVLEFQVEARNQGRGLQRANPDALEIGQRFDALSNYAQNARFEGLVALPSGRTLPFPLSANRDSGGVESLRRCPAGGGDCVADETIRLLTQGTAMRITSRTSDGRPAVVDYSLVGYQSAMTSISALCGDRRIIARMIRR